MSKKKGKKGAVGLLVLAAAAAAGGAFYLNFGRDTVTTSETEAARKTETVQYGSVVSGITESGSVTFGELEQVFSLAAIMEVSAGSEESSSGAESAVSGDMGVMMGAGSETEAMAMMGAGAGISGGSSSGSSDPDTGDVSLEVAEVYVASGQVVESGDPVLQISEDSIAEYRSEMEAAVATASELQNPVPCLDCIRHGRLPD